MKSKPTWLRLLLFVALLAGMAGLIRALGVGSHLDALRQWIAGLGSMGPLAFVAVYAVAVVAAVPGSALTVLAGALFGSALGVALVSAGSTLGACLAFLVSRYLARDAVTAWLGQNEKFRRLDEMTARHGAFMVAVARLVPLFPFNLVNYGFGLTRVGFWTYASWSWLCMLPGTILYVVGADVVVSGVARGQIPWPLVGVMAIAVTLLAAVVTRAKRHLERREKESSA